MTTWWCELAVLTAGIRRDVTIETAADRITGVTTDTTPPPNATRLAGITIPGLANTHSHAFHRALRSRSQADSGSFWTWRDTMYEAAGRLDPDRYYQLGRAVYGEMALAGHTAVGEFHYVHHQPDGTPYAEPNAMGEAVLAAAADVGIRITLLDTLYLHGGLTNDGYLPPQGVQLRFRDRDADGWLDRVDAIQPGPDHQVGAAVHSVRAVDPGSIADVVEWSQRRQVPLHAHVSEQVAENAACIVHHGLTPLELFADVGALGPRFSAVHATHLTASDIGRIGDAQATVCFCPTTERDLGDGIGPSTELVAAGVNLHLGSDSHAIIDHFEEARALELNQRLRCERRGLHQASDLLAMATRNGHRALGWDDAGMIQVGARADLVTVRLDSVRAAGAPMELAAATVVFAATAADVTNVVSGGRVIVRDARHTSIDVPSLLDRTIKELWL